MTPESDKSLVPLAYAPLEEHNWGLRIKQLFLRFLAPLVYAILVLILYGTHLFGSNVRILGKPGSDITAQFIAWRYFGFNELKQGHLALWNPYIFCGSPYFGGFQSALLYPINWIHLFLPTSLAINWEIAINSYLAGFFTYLWVRGRGIGKLGAIFAGAIYMLSHPFYLHMLAGHLPHLAVMAWMPVVLLALDGWQKSSGWKWFIIGSVGVAMQIFGGHPQYVYFGFIGVVLYQIVENLTTWHGRPAHVPCRKGENSSDHSKPKFRLRDCTWARRPCHVFLIYLGGALLAAIQLGAGIDAASESWRAGGLPYSFASQFAFPPENIATLLTPGLFGDAAYTLYVGRWQLWEASLFFGVTGLVMAVIGWSTLERLPKWLWASFFGLLLIFALGFHTPLYHLMFDDLPGYSGFRSASKFVFLIVLFAAMFAGMGIEAMSGLKNVRRPLILCGIVGICCLISSAILWFNPNIWQTVLNDIRQTGEVCNVQTEPGAATAITKSASAYLLVAGITVGIVGFLLRRAQTSNMGRAFLVCFGITELMAFSLGYLDDNDPKLSISLATGFQRSLTRDEMRANDGMILHRPDAWGYDPGIIKRCLQLLASTQGITRPDQITQSLDLTRLPPVLALFRCGTVPMPEAKVMEKIEVIPDSISRLARLNHLGFDFRSTIILEKMPNLTTTKASGEATASVHWLRTDAMELQGEAPRGGVLLITNAYSQDWRGSLPANRVGPNYDILPADHAFIGVPLTPGHFDFLLIYEPPHFMLGKWISIVCIMLLGAVLTIAGMRKIHSWR